MTLNEVLIRQNFISKIKLAYGVDELTKKPLAEVSAELKVKIMGMRIKLGKFRKSFEEDVQEAIKGLKPDGFDELAQKQDKTPEEEVELQHLNEKINKEYNLFLIEKGKEEAIFDEKFTEDEYYQIVTVNSSNNVEINGTPLPAEEFLEVIYSLFVE